ncbi:MAG TPA: hypothetical protein VLG12_06655 [Candidatus Saccharimonadales bacterium]|nr:hypothetical protein [Candidatus Saccharimonadales bacterium]
MINKPSAIISKKAINTKLIKSILIATIFVIVILFFTIKVEFRVNQSKNNDIVIPSPTVSLRKRTVYNFGKLMTEKLLKYENTDMGFSIGYLPEEQPYIHEDKNLQTDFVGFGKEISNGAVSFGLSSQPSGAYELYDGFNLSIISFPLESSKSLEQLVHEAYVDHYDQYGFGTKVVGVVLLSGNKAWKIASCCMGGENYSYYLSTKNNKYLRIDIYSLGPEKDKFNLVVDRMLSSIIIIH